MKLGAIFKPDHERYEGVRPFNVYFLRLLFLVVFVFLGKDAWTSLLYHRRSWDPYTTAAFCMWAAFALISLIGVFHPLKMLPLMIFEVMYKVLYLILVSYPLWSANRLAGSPEEEMTFRFLPVILGIVAVPWKYALDRYILNRDFK
jgi:hypothetical protein